MTFIPSINNKISSANSTSSLLTGGATFTGTWEAVENFNFIRTAILTDNATDGTLYFDLSMDGGTTFISVSRSVGDTTFNFPHKISVVESYVRIRYVNGTTAQTTFFNLQTTYSVSDNLSLNYLLNGTITDENEASLVLASLIGRDLNGVHRHVPTDFDAIPRVNNMNAWFFTYSKARGENDIEMLRRAGLDDGQILEINQVVSYFCYANRMVLGLGIHTEGDIIGLSPGDSSDPDNWSHT